MFLEPKEMSVETYLFNWFHKKFPEDKIEEKNLRGIPCYTITPKGHRAPYIMITKSTHHIYIYNKSNYWATSVLPELVAIIKEGVLQEE